ncbi:PH domain-containing protein [Altererythrobacter sp. BO-6]|uniref:PH domain-containing protein n=1 Tax=Altererythrobacter sp. BO-6 TaxID=2604537 RepID=UPI0013E13DA8|nr:PH domain-containing protein [Altererythrobacter sp. BO-6]QIG52943.1 PH domain-containing protein [Altererythrobacter sp. BO-6]
MEKTNDSFRSSLGRWLVGTSAGLGTLALAIAGFAVLIGAAGDLGPWPLLLTALAAAIVIWKWLQVMSEKFELNSQRLVVRRGIITKSIDEVELYRVKDIRMDFSLLNQLAGIGTIHITSSDETTRNQRLVLRHVPHALERREQLRNLVDAARRERGVREIDLVNESS